MRRLRTPWVDAVPAEFDPAGGPADIGAFGGPDADRWDLDGDGDPAWYGPGPYDPASGLDCDDFRPEVGPGRGC